MWADPNINTTKDDNIHVFVYGKKEKIIKKRTKNI